MAAYLLPIFAFLVLLAMILRDAESYKRTHEQRRSASAPADERGGSH